MTDIVTPAIRSKMMAGIRSKDTKPELVIRKGLFRRGFRYRLHDKKLPGTPDMVLPRFRAVVFVHGCFWHGHRCALFRLPATRTGFWKDKITRNQNNDKKALVGLHAAGWRVATIWECALKGPGKLNISEILDTLENWLASSDTDMEIRGNVVSNRQKPLKHIW
ncbi:MAG TPA: DNA mismatch endonuclease Vsr [Burkholderiaceae bacterium]|nr:DNA mismatch endonuclease Vsr [Burkholderiaceae bacterium]